MCLKTCQRDLQYMVQMFQAHSPENFSGFSCRLLKNKKMGDKTIKKQMGTEPALA